MAVTDIAIGDNRLAFAIIVKDGPLIMDRINIKLSIAKDNLEDYYGAISDYSKAIEINPRFADAY